MTLWVKKFLKWLRTRVALSEPEGRGMRIGERRVPFWGER